MKLDPTSLRLFVRVAEMGTITGAADAEFIATSAVSKRLSELEAHFSTPLLHRNNRGVELTPAGNALLHLSRGVLHNLEDLDLQMRDYTSGERGIIRIFANMSAITQYLPGETQAFFEKHPDIGVQLEEKVSPVITREIMANGADIGICAKLPHGYDLAELPYHTDELVLVTPLNHPLANRDAIDFRDSLEHAYVGLHSSSAINLQLLKAASLANRPLRLRIQVTSYDALCLMVQAGLGIGVVPRGAIRQYVGGLQVRVLPIRDDWAKRPLCIYVNNIDRISMAARLFVDHLIESSNNSKHQPAVEKSEKALKPLLI
ncbi:LysR family transcriptional regulator [Halomonas sp. MES3-P3E]|uniref:LysR family transcriptional regulator n=1 Tax=Halomonas sp. MES3-P3E TaxID=2058321 RepID=UPI000C322FEA|nr:LysR family transcriptional regulator [Halomonas sp. MES3-P3E]PKG54179.1 LysR family transcriptional regulator [Halomonas sp. MES3-P3E]